MATGPSLQSGPLYDLLTQQGVTFIRFENREFGHAYPYGNKIEALKALPVGEPIVFFDSDTLITGNLAEVPFDFNRPSGSLRREATWSKVIAGGQTAKPSGNHFMTALASTLPHR